MSQLPNEEIEGRLIAQREMLVLLLTLASGRSPDPAALWRRLDEEFQFRNHQEDPGALPTRAFAIEAAMMREFRLIAEQAKARLADETG